MPHGVAVPVEVPDGDSVGVWLGLVLDDGLVLGLELGLELGLVLDDGLDVALGEARSHASRSSRACCSSA